LHDIISDLIAKQLIYDVWQ